MPARDQHGPAVLPPELDECEPRDEQHAGRERQGNPEHGQLQDGRLFFDLLGQGGHEEGEGACAHDKDEPVDQGGQIGLPGRGQAHDEGLHRHVRALGIRDGSADEGNGQERDF